MDNKHVGSIVKIGNKKYEITAYTKSEKAHRNYSIEQFYGKQIDKKYGKEKLIYTVENGEY